MTQGFLSAKGRGLRAKVRKVEFLPNPEFALYFGSARIPVFARRGKTDEPLIDTAVPFL